MVHVDDFLSVGNDESLKSTRQTLEEKYKIKVQVLGPNEDCVQEICVFNKIVRGTPEGIELEADPRHAEIVIKELGMQGANEIKLPGAKDKSQARKEGQDSALAGTGGLEEAEGNQDDEEFEELSTAEAARVDIRFAAKEDARVMCMPVKKHRQLL